MMNVSYIIKGVLRRYLPAWVHFLAMHLRGKANASETTPRAVLIALKGRFAKWGVPDIEGRRIIEVGSGRYARLGIQMLAEGAASVELMDLYAVPVTDPSHAECLRADCRSIGRELGELMPRLTTTHADFLSLSAEELQDKAADILFSGAVLEHVEDPAKFLQQVFYCLRPGGMTVHVIDLRDHSFDTPFEMLTFSERMWNRWLDMRGGFHLNRWRASDYVAAMQAAGFDDVRFEVSMKDEAGLKAVLPRLHSRFKAMDPGLLAIQVIELYGRKPIPASTGLPTRDAHI